MIIVHIKNTRVKRLAFSVERIRVIITVQETITFSAVTKDNMDRARFRNVYTFYVEVY